MQRCRDSADPHPSVCSTREVGNVLESGACPGIAIVRMSQGLCQKYSALSLPMMLNLPNQLENPLLPQNSTKVISLISEKLPTFLPHPAQEETGEPLNRTRGGETGYGG